MSSHSPQFVSSKGSCPASTSTSMPPIAPPGGKDDGLIDLYIDGDGGSPLLVGRGKIVEGATVCHHVPLTSDVVRVNVLEVIESLGSRPLPIACAEFVSVIDALRSFVPWPLRLLHGAVQVC